MRFFKLSFLIKEPLLVLYEVPFLFVAIFHGAILAMLEAPGGPDLPSVGKLCVMFMTQLCLLHLGVETPHAVSFTPGS